MKLHSKLLDLASQPHSKLWTPHKDSTPGATDGSVNHPENGPNDSPLEKEGTGEEGEESDKEVGSLIIVWIL